jgi:hypothetical protein
MTGLAWRAKGLLLLAGILVLRGRASAQARTAPLADGISPDRKYAILAAQALPHGRMTYEIVRRSTGAVLLQMRSSYREEPGEAVDWSWHQTKDAEVIWRMDSHAVALNETNHQWIGTTLIAWRHDVAFQRVNLNQETLNRLTKVPWERVRIEFEKFVGNQLGRIRMGGRYGPPPGPYQEAAFSITLRLSDGHPIRCRHQSAAEN